MKPVIFKWIQTSDEYFARLVASNPQYKKRVEESLSSMEEYLEELADKGEWEEIAMSIPFDQLVSNGILINDVGNEDRMFLFVTLNEKSAGEMITGLFDEHYPHVFLLDLITSVKG